eukprot:scaffold84667_cov31-Tisochrysis_lutea.AAC.5
MVGLDQLPAAVGQAHLERRGRLRLVYDNLGGIGRRRRGCRGGGTFVTHRAPSAAERLEFDRRRLVGLTAPVNKVDIALCLPVLACELGRKASPVYVGEECRVGGVGRVTQRPVVHTKPIGPKGNRVFLRARWLRCCLNDSRAVERLARA